LLPLHDGQSSAIAGVLATVTTSTIIVRINPQKWILPPSMTVFL